MYVSVHARSVTTFVSDSLRPYGLHPARLLCQWDSPGKNTGVGCHAILQGIFLTQGSNLDLPCLHVYVYVCVCMCIYMYMCVYSWNIYLGVLYLYIFIYKVYISSKYIYEVYIFRIFICMKCICMCYSQFGERIKGQRSMWNWSLERVCSLVRRGEWDGHLLLYSPIPVLKNGCKKNLTSWSLFIFP